MADRPIIFSGATVRAILAGTKSQTRRIIRDTVPEAPGMDHVHPKNQIRHAAPYLDAYCGQPRTPANPRGMGEWWCWWTRDDRAGPQFKVGFKPGDRLWVRENHQFRGASYNDGTESEPSWSDEEWFRCWGSGGAGDCWDPDFPAGWSPSRHMGVHDLTGLEHDEGEAVRGLATKVLPSIHMPRWASRITLEVTEVRVERLQDISHDDAAAEGLIAERTPAAGILRNVAMDLCTPLVRTRWQGAPDLPLRGMERAAYRDLWNSIHGKDAWDANPWVAAISFRVILANIDAPPASPLATGEAANPNQQTRLSASGAHHYGGAEMGDRCQICGETAPEPATLCLRRVAGVADRGVPCDYSKEGDARFANEIGAEKAALVMGALDHAPALSGETSSNGGR